MFSLTGFDPQVRIHQRGVLVSKVQAYNIPSLSDQEDEINESCVHWIYQGSKSDRCMTCGLKSDRCMTCEPWFHSASVWTVCKCWRIIQAFLWFSNMILDVGQLAIQKCIVWLIVVCMQLLSILNFNPQLATETNVKNNIFTTNNRQIIWK